jgi:hypothetical protein
MESIPKSELDLGAQREASGRTDEKDKEMNKKEFHHPGHEKHTQRQDGRIEIESERGWAGQHGQHPESPEEEKQVIEYRKPKPAAPDKNHGGHL